MRHTPGPWRVSSKSKYLVRTDDFRVCQVFKSNSNPSLNEIATADAQLIAAAPEMLKCLQAIVARIHGVYDDPALIEWGGLHHDSDQDILIHAEELIAKAIGDEDEEIS